MAKDSHTLGTADQKSLDDRGGDLGVDPTTYKSARQLLSEENRPWYQWFSKYDTPAERKLLFKLDLLIVAYAFVLYWIRYIDSSNISNAYVSGMATDLNFTGNQLTQLWGLFTLVQYKSNSFSQVMAFRFMVGVFEAPFMTGFHWVAGSWYRGDELGRRGGFFYLGLSLGGMTAGLLQASLLKHLDGVRDLAAWRWMFIVNGAMTFPIGLAGYFIWPGTPDKCLSYFISKEEVELAKARLIRFGNKIETEPLSWKHVKRIALSWRPWALTLWCLLFFNVSPLGSAYILWLRQTFPTDLVKVNQLSTTASGLGMFFVVLVNFGADWIKSPPIAIVSANVLLLIGNVILCTGTTNHAARFTAYNLLPAAIGQSAILYGFSNYIMRRDPQERALTIVTMTIVGGLASAFVPLATYPTSKSPRFKAGYIYSTIITIIQIFYTIFIGWMSKRDDEKYAAEDMAKAIDQLGPAAFLPQDSTVLASDKSAENEDEALEVERDLLDTAVVPAVAKDVKG
ncbi:hypothetical protein IAT38_006191 [Cryptococcus sp. DSM 104549]